MKYENMPGYEKEIIDFDKESEVNRISQWIKKILRDKLKKRGLVVAMSGGIDSSVCAALSVKALGSEKVHGLILPEKDSSSDSSRLALELAEQLGIEFTVQNIENTLESIGCYQWRDEAIKSLFPNYDHRWKSKIVLKGGLEGKINYFELIVESPDHGIHNKRLGLKEYLQIVAATNYKQRVRKSIEYFHADRLNYAVVGTPNRLEYDQGFFVKNGDGAADIKPIAHLYKTQVYALAKFMDLPHDIQSSVPTTDTFSLEQGQDEFYFALQYREMDISLWAYNNGKSYKSLSETLGVNEEYARMIYQDILRKRKTTEYLHFDPFTIENI